MPFIWKTTNIHIPDVLCTSGVYFTSVYPRVTDPSSVAGLRSEGVTTLQHVKRLQFWPLNKFDLIDEEKKEDEIQDQLHTRIKTALREPDPGMSDSAAKSKADKHLLNT